MAKDQHGGFTPPKGNPSGNGRNQQGTKSAFAGINPGSEEKVAARYTENDELAANVKVRHQTGT